MRGSQRAAAVLISLGLLAGGLSFASPATAASAPIGAFASWSATATGFDGVFSAASGFPTAHVTTTASGTTIAAGKSAFLGASTGFGQHFGSSRLQPYLTIGTAALLAPSTTTITFDVPTSPGWGFALGDIDADYVTIQASAGSIPLTSAELGAQDTGGTPYLNYCRNASPKPGGCAASDAPYDSFPLWCPSGSVGVPCDGKPENSVVGSGSDTSGSYDWFIPTVPVDSMTLTFTALIGIPSYQLWLVAPSAATTVSGTVEVGPPGSTVPAGVEVALLDAGGAAVRDIEDEPFTAPVAADGSFSFVTEPGDYQLDIVIPAGLGLEKPGQFPLGFTASGESLNLGPLRLVSPLPATGLDAGAVLVSAALALCLGLLLVSAGRRRAA